MSPFETLSHFLLPKELDLLAWKKIGKVTNLVTAEKSSQAEVCPKCASLSRTGYDKRWVTIKDAPIRDKLVLLRIRKRRFFCKPCQKPFTEYVEGILPGRRTTQRFRRSLLWACENFSNLRTVQKHYRCSAGFIYGVVYDQLQLNLKKKLNYPWPEVIGIDEHFFSRSFKGRQFATVFTDMKNRRLRELVLGREKRGLLEATNAISGAENVRWIALDLSSIYRSFALERFPNANLVADKFHVLRLLNGAINRRRKSMMGDRRTHPIRKLLLRSFYRLKFYEKRALLLWLENYPEIQEIHFYKERLHALYRAKGFNRAQQSLDRLLEDMRASGLPEIQTLRRTLQSWRNEILNYFRSGLTNARTEGFNRIASLVKNKAFGYRNFQNYRLRLLNACS